MTRGRKKNNKNKLLSATGLLVNPSQDSSLRKRNWKMNSPLARQAKAFIGHMPFTRYKSRFQVTLITTKHVYMYPFKTWSFHRPMQAVELTWGTRDSVVVEILSNIYGVKCKRKQTFSVRLGCAITGTDVKS